MKKISFTFLIALLFLASVNIYNNNVKIIISRLDKNGNIHPEKLRYRINFAGVIPIGEAVFDSQKVEEFQGRPVYHLTASARSLGIFSKLFSSYAFLDSYIDTQQFNPILFRQKLVVKGRKNIEKEAAYDQKQGIMSRDGVRRQILPNTQDPLSALFNVRRMDFDKEKEFEMNINTNQKNYILKGIAHPKNIPIQKKIYRAVFLEAEISRRDKNPYHKSKIAMVLLRDKENIPILIKAFSGGFLINAKLIDIQ